MEKSSKTSDNTDDESNKYDEDIIKQEYEKQPKAIVKREKQLSFSDCSFSVFCNLENALQNIEPLVVPPKTVPATKSGPGRKRTKASEAAAAAAAAQQLSSRPKMIHTEKTRVPIVDGKRKSKTLITRTSAGKSTKLNNSRKHNVRTVHTNSKPDLSNENGYARNLSETELLLELSKKKIKYNPDVVNDLEEILRSPIKSNHSAEDLVQTDIGNVLKKSPDKWTTVSAKEEEEEDEDGSDNLHRSIDGTTIKEEPPYNMPTDDEVFTCEMCSAVFRDRAQLLIHVPIHI